MPDYTTHPRHEQMGLWLAARGSGRAIDPDGSGSGVWEGWTPSDGPKQDIEAEVEGWWTERQAAARQFAEARATRRAQLRSALNNWDTLPAAQQTAVIRTIFPALVREVRELLGEEP